MCTREQTDSHRHNHLFNASAKRAPALMLLATDAPPLHSFAILTTSPSDLVRPLHDRMPVILRPEDWPVWLGEVAANDDQRKALLHSGNDEQFERIAVSPRVNSHLNDDPSLLEPLTTHAEAAHPKARDGRPL